MEEKIYSEQTNRWYFMSKVCRIVNMKQGTLYLKHGAFLMDIYASEDEEGNPMTVMVFDREETKGMYEKWCRRELV